MSSSTKGVALVTGAGSRRVGNTVARMLAERGYDIALHCHTSRDSARQSVAEFRALAVQAKAFQANVASESEVDRLFAEVHRRFGRLDVLVTAASRFRSKSLELTTADDVRGNFEVDVLGTFLCCRRAGLMMAEQPQGGLIVTIGDWAVLRPYRNYAAYLIAKGTIPTMTRMLAVELARRNPAVRVNCIMPGPVMIPADLPDEERQESIAGTLVHREGRPENVGKAVLSFIDNDFVTGASLVVDGGRLLAGGNPEQGFPY
jgi:pteridine reductase